MNNRKWMWAAAALFCSAALAADVEAQGVKVNGREIPQSRIDAMVKAQLAQGQPDSPELRNKVKEELINREILAQEAQKKGLEKQPEVMARIDLARQEIVLGAYLNEYVKANPITEDAMKKEYERVKSQASAKEYKAHHILVEKEDEAKGLIAQIKKGAKFEKLAAKNSKDQGSKGKGGELDWSPAERYVKPFGEALSKLKKGQMTDAPGAEPVRLAHHTAGRRARYQGARLRRGQAAAAADDAEPGDPEARRGAARQSEDRVTIPGSRSSAGGMVSVWKDASSSRCVLSRARSAVTKHLPPAT